MRLFKVLSFSVALLGLTMTHAMADDEFPPACHGNNIFEALKTTDPAGYAEIKKAAAAKLNSGPLYWKITPPNGAKPSYLLGTIHVTDSRVALPSETLKKRIANSTVAVFELPSVANRDGMSMAILGDTARTQMPEGKSLWDLIPDDKEAIIRALPTIAKIPTEVLSRLQPWLLMSMLSSPPCEEKRKEFKFVLDAALFQHAQIARVDTAGLETIPEQLDVFSSLSLDEQAAMLVDQTSQIIPAEDIFQTTVELYLSQQVAALEPLLLYISKKSGIARKAADDRFMANLLNKRNVVMADRAKPFLDKGAAFIAVGSLHLYGEDGLVELLRKAGYKVKAEK
jgi:uncharacterized protein